MLLDKSITIRASPAAVFAWLAPARMARWDASLIRFVPEGPLATGARFERVQNALGLRFTSAAEAVAVEPGRVFAWRQVAGDFERHRGAFLLEPCPEGTCLRLVADVELPFVLPHLTTEAQVRHALSHDADEALYRLKDLVEGAAVPTNLHAAS